MKDGLFQQYSLGIWTGFGIMHQMIKEQITTEKILGIGYRNQLIVALKAIK